MHHAKHMLNYEYLTSARIIHIFESVLAIKQVLSFINIRKVPHEVLKTLGTLGMLMNGKSCEIPPLSKSVRLANLCNELLQHRHVPWHLFLYLLFFVLSLEYCTVGTVKAVFLSR